MKNIDELYENERTTDKASLVGHTLCFKEDSKQIDTVYGAQFLYPNVEDETSGDIVSFFGSTVIDKQLIAKGDRGILKQGTNDKTGRKFYYFEKLEE